MKDWEIASCQDAKFQAGRVPHTYKGVIQLGMDAMLACLTPLKASDLLLVVRNGRSEVWTARSFAARSLSLCPFTTEVYKWYPTRSRSLRFLVSIYASSL